MDSVLTAVIIGIVEGCTEFLPISSTGHMILAGHLIGFTGPEAAVFEVTIQLGAILSVIYVYRDKFRRFFRKEGWDAGLGLSVWHVAAGIAPVMGIAFFLHGPIKTYLFSPVTVAAGLILGGILMLLAEKYGRLDAADDVGGITLKQALYVGLFQIFSLWPGFSRSGSTIAGGLFIGLSRKAAAEFSFIIAAPLMFAACLYDLYKNFALLGADSMIMIITGFITAFITSWLSIVWFLRFLNSSSLAAFSYYRFILAAVSLCYFL